MGAIYRREMGAFFSSPIAYIVLAVFYLFSGYFFYQSSILYSVSNLSSAFSAMFLVIVFIIPIMTMKLMSEEKKQKTDQGLLTAPIKLSSIVLGKYFAALTLYVFAVSIFLVFALILQFYGGVQWSEVFSNYIALTSRKCVYRYKPFHFIAYGKSGNSSYRRFCGTYGVLSA